MSGVIDAALLALLRCPRCGGALGAAVNGEGPLVCTACAARFPVVRGIPRFAPPRQDDFARRTKASFGYEWTHFHDWQQSGAQNFQDYFAGANLQGLRNAVVLDAGCGMGRHARQLAPFVRRLIAVDFSAAIEQAAANVGGCSNVTCVEADLLALPFTDASFDYVYSLGVLHHIDDTEAALAALAAKVRPGGRLRIYLYWKRRGWSGRLLYLVSAVRRVTTKLPFGMLRAACWLLSVGLYALIVLPYRALSRIGVRRHEQWPLFVYTRYPFNVLYNDQFDRFSAPIEKRYDGREVVALLERAGLVGVELRSCFGWVAEAVKPER